MFMLHNFILFTSVARLGFEASSNINLFSSNLYRFTWKMIVYLVIDLNESLLSLTWSVSLTC